MDVETVVADGCEQLRPDAREDLPWHGKASVENSVGDLSRLQRTNQTRWMRPLDEIGRVNHAVL